MIFHLETSDILLQIFQPWFIGSSITYVHVLHVNTTLSITS